MTSEAPFSTREVLIDLVQSMGFGMEDPLEGNEVIVVSPGGKQSRLTVTEIDGREVVKVVTQVLDQVSATERAATAGLDWSLHDPLCKFCLYRETEQLTLENELLAEFLDQEELENTLRAMWSIVDLRAEEAQRLFGGVILQPLEDSELRLGEHPEDLADKIEAWLEEEELRFSWDAEMGLWELATEVHELPTFLGLGDGGLVYIFASIRSESSTPDIDAVELLERNGQIAFGGFAVDDEHVVVLYRLSSSSLDRAELSAAIDGVTAAADAWWSLVLGDALRDVPVDAAHRGRATAVWAAGATFQTGQVIDGFRILERRNKGAFGTVYLAEDLELDQEVALKVLDPALQGDPDALARFRREPELTAGVAHPNLLKVLGEGNMDRLPYIVYELIDGKSLHELIADDWPLGWQRCGRLVQQIAGALQELHNAGVVHRDVKPDNIMVRQLEDDEEAILIDLGVAYDPEASSRLTQLGYVSPGTPRYMAPESLASRKPSIAADQYALAITAFEMRAGRVPLSDVTTDTIFESGGIDPPRLSEMDEAAPEEVCDVLDRALARKPKDRYGSVLEFADAFAEACKTAPPEVENEQPIQQDIQGYLEWESIETPEPLTGRIGDVAQSLLDIISAEAPVSCERVFRLYLSGTERRQLTHAVRTRLARALRRLVDDGSVLVDNEWERKPLRERILKLPGGPDVLVRDLGPRRPDDLPPKEIAGLADLLQTSERLDTRELKRRILAVYGRRRSSAAMDDIIDTALMLYA